MSNLANPYRTGRAQDETIEENEFRPLRGIDLDDTIPRWLDDRVWVRVPALVWRKIRVQELFNTILWLKRVVGGTINLALPVVPVAIVSGVQGWNCRVVFALNLLGLAPLGLSLDLLIEEFVLPLREWAARPVLWILTHIFPLTVSCIT